MSNRKIKLTNEIKLVYNNEDKIEIYTPYNAKFIAKIRNIGAKWDANKSCWEVPTELDGKTRIILQDSYGSPLSADETMLSIAIDPYKFYEGREIIIGGKRLCWRSERDLPVNFADDTYLSEGSFSRSGGSRNNPDVFGDITQGLVLKTIIPISLYDRLPNDQKDEVEILEKIEKEQEDIDALKEKREKLLSELRDVEEKIENLETE